MIIGKKRPVFAVLYATIVEKYKRETCALKYMHGNLKNCGIDFLTQGNLGSNKLFTSSYVNMGLNRFSQLSHQIGSKLPSIDRAPNNKSSDKFCEICGIKRIKTWFLLNITCAFDAYIDGKTWKSIDCSKYVSSEELHLVIRSKYRFKKYFKLLLKIAFPC